MSTDVKFSDTFYINAELQEKNTNNKLINELKQYSESCNQQVYILKKPLLEREVEYDFDSGAILLIPNHKICFIDFINNEDEDEFKDYIDDVISDLESLVKDYGYLKRLGRKRKWAEKLINNYRLEEIEEIVSDYDLDEIILESDVDKRNVNILISLLIGSINSVDKIGEEVPQTELEKIKQKIILFDGEQTRFIFENVKEHVLNVQGLAGTGKTELLFHKLKELYLENDTNKIAFTCYNKILANSLNKRVPDFFSYMKVNEQIEWNERLWVMPSWGSKTDKNSGLYSYITNYYNLTFNRYNKYNMDLEEACKIALKELTNIENFETCFDYILIDESQDFPKNFFTLCEKVTNKQVIKVGDIFQNITDTVPSKDEADILLNRCYRTDNRNLMFSHALSMGLFEKNKKRWFEEEEWGIIGYNYEKLDNGKVQLSRTPTKRFDDVDHSENPFTRVIKCDNNINESRNISKLNDKVFETIKEIKKINPQVRPHDIAVIYLNNSSRMYELTHNLKVKLAQQGINSNFGYESKKVEDESIFITNRFNVKGLEFPFVICVENEGIREDYASRNALYMAMTRSFISSYLIIENISNEFYEILQNEIIKLEENNALIINQPTHEEIKELDGLNMKVNDHLSLEEAVELILNDYKEPNKQKRARILKSTINTFSATSFDYNKVKDYIDLLLMRVLNDEE